MTTEMFERSSWDERYSGSEEIWSGNPNAQLVAEVSGLTAGTALDVGWPPISCAHRTAGWSK
jgi:hypothetical protein